MIIVIFWPTSVEQACLTCLPLFAGLLGSNRSNLLRLFGTLLLLFGDRMTEFFGLQFDNTTYYAAFMQHEYFMTEIAQRSSGWSLAYGLYGTDGLPSLSQRLVVTRCWPRVLVFTYGDESVTNARK